MEQPDIMLDENPDEPEAEEPQPEQQVEENPPSPAEGPYLYCLRCRINVKCKCEVCLQIRCRFLSFNYNILFLIFFLKNSDYFVTTNQSGHCIIFTFGFQMVHPKRRKRELLSKSITRYAT